jgi:hypothetical protein
MKLKNIIYNIIGVAVMTLSFAACDNIDEADRLIYVEPELPKVDTTAYPRCILVEEFSGQFCVNCPDGAKTLHEIQDAYGADTVIVATIHAGSLALNEDEVPGWIGLANPIGERFYESVGKPSLPAAVINRQTSAIGRLNWLGEINKALSLPAFVKLSIERQYDAATRQLNITVIADANADFNGNLHVWLTEDNIEAYQDYPTTYDEKYIHNNIFRTSLTAEPISGDAISLSIDAETPSEYQYNVTLREDYKPENMSIIAFVDNANGVAQAARIKLAD